MGGEEVQRPPVATGAVRPREVLPFPTLMTCYALLLQSVASATQQPGEGEGSRKGTQRSFQGHRFKGCISQYSACLVLFVGPPWVGIHYVTLDFEYMLVAVSNERCVFGVPIFLDPLPHLRVFTDPGHGQRQNNGNKKC